MVKGSPGDSARGFLKIQIMRKCYKAIKVNGEKKDEHRHIMEVHLGRKLTRNEVVHHVDGNKHNNDISNLEVMQRSEHSRMHMLVRPVKPETIEKIRAFMKANSIGRPNLSDSQVINIRQLLALGYSCASIGRLYKIHRTSVSDIKRGKTYSRV